LLLSGRGFILNFINADKLIWIDGLLEEKFLFSPYFTNAQIVGALLVILAAFIISRIMRYVISNRLRITRGIAETDVERLSMLKSLHAPVMIIIYLVALRISISILNPPHIMDAYLKIIHVLITITTTWFAFRFFDIATEYLVNKYKDSDEKVVTSMFPIITKSVKVVVVLISFILVIQNLGYSASSLLAGLGIGGLAVAFAAQNTLANIFGSVMIFIDKPFVIGDWIVVKDVEGIVEDVGFRTTRIRTWDKNEVSVPNSIVSNEIIQNFTRRPQRRFREILNVTYDTTPAQIEQAVQIIREIIQNHPKTDKESYRVYFTEFGNSHLGILVQFFFLTADFIEFLEGRQEIFLEIMRKFKEIGVSFAFPSRTIYFGDKNAHEMMNRFTEKSLSQHPQEINIHNNSGRIPDGTLLAGQYEDQ
jgi:MscS family membrane protein